MTPTVKRIAFGAVAGLLALGLGAGAFVHAQDQTNTQPQRPFRGPGGPGRFGGPGGGPLGMLPMLGREINLTDTQRDQIKAIADSHKDEWKAISDREWTAREALNAAITADTVNDALVRQKSAEVAAVEADAAVARAHAYAEVMQILTPDQKIQLKQMQARMKEHRGR
ncbi:MAG TPA: Spy/CpxP family protein refolding chaperone [Vicinamibacterales bacterium]|nr:Spy/CpxP family protein refolding chaperone [Vicinamibacterales bacterium]